MFRLPWWKIQKKRQQEYDEELAHRMALELREERELAEKKEMRSAEAEHEQDIRVQREFAEAGITGASGKASKIRKFLASLKRGKKKALESLAAAREQAEDTIADRQTKPVAPKLEAVLKNRQKPELRLRVKG
ncbi:MAG: hypothetical protein ABTQ34_06795 [Bdellovibrionales bacterium]